MTWTASAALASSLAVKADAAPEHADGEWRNKRPGMSYRRLGRTNYMISEIICGGNEIRPDNYEHVVEAFEMGLNYFDTAIAYGGGRSELGYARAIKAVGRDNIFLNTKVSPWSSNRNRLLAAIYESLGESEKRKTDRAVGEELEKRRALAPDYLCGYFGGQEAALVASARSNVLERRYGAKIEREKNYKRFMIEHVENSLRRLETDHLDLVMCPHAANTYDEVTKFPEIFEAFESLKAAGKARHLAVSSHSDPAGVLEGAADAGVYSAAMVAYNIVNKSYLDAALDKAKQADLGVIAMKVARPVHHGRRDGRPNDPRRVAMIEEWMPGGELHLAQKCYLWALQDSRIAACNSNMVDSGQVKMNLAVAGRKVSA